MAKKPKKTPIQKANEYKAVGNSLKNKGKLTLGQHFIKAAELIEEQAERIKELEAE